MSENKEKMSEHMSLYEALMPDLTKDSFEFAGQTVKLMPLRPKAQIAFAKVIQDVTIDVNHTMDLGRGNARLAEALMGNLEKLYEAAVILFNDMDPDSPLTAEALQEMRGVQPEQALKLILAAVSKNEAIGKPVADLLGKLLTCGDRFISQNQPLWNRLLNGDLKLETLLSASTAELTALPSATDGASKKSSRSGDRK